LSTVLALGCGSVKGSNPKPDAANQIDAPGGGSTNCILDTSKLDNCKL
jgi:hypothetical protein